MTRKRSLKWLVLVAALLLAVASSGCGGRPPATRDSDGEVYVDFGAIYRRTFSDGQHMKIELWQKIDGVEAEGWMTLDVSEADGLFTFDYAGELGDYAFSDSHSFQFEAPSTAQTFDDHFSTAYEPMRAIWREIVWHWAEECFGALEKVGDRRSILESDFEVTAVDEYAGQSGITFRMWEGGELTYQICLSPDVPVNLYSYTKDAASGNEYRATLAEFND